MKARALLAWEFGAGRTHAVQILGVARQLKARGVECLAALYEPMMLEEFAALGVPVVQTYVWPGRRRTPTPWRDTPINALGDVFANLGMAAPNALTAAIGHYDGLFQLFQPDIVLADNAFGALLAARGRLPAIAFGTNACLSPARDGRFVLRPDASGDAATFSEDSIRDAFNRQLEALGRPALATLPEILIDGGIYPFGPPAFDVYRETRSSPALPNHLPDFALPDGRGRGEGVFAYIHTLAETVPAVREGIAASGLATTLYQPGLSLGGRERLGANVELRERALPLPWIVSSPRCIVHHGGPQLTIACLAAGRPQVILAKETDNVVTGRFVAENGLGFACHLGQTEADWLAGAIRRAHDDGALGERCRARAHEFADWMSPDPCATVADAAVARLASRG